MSASFLEKRIWLSPPDLNGRERELVVEALESNWIAPVGPLLDEFERRFAARTGARHAVALASATAALHLAMRVAGVGPGDEVVTSTFTFIASITPALMQGARPVFVDSDPGSWCMSPALLERFLSDRARVGRLPKLVIPVHIYGQCCDMVAIRDICGRHEVAVIEDAAEAVGAECASRHAGVFGKAGVFSFNGNKIITTSSGGMLVTDDADFAAQARFFAAQARDAAPHYQHSAWGYNYRMSNVLAGIGLGQLERLDEKVARRREHFEAYRAAFADLPGVTFMPEASYGRGTRWLTCLTVDPKAAGTDREKIRLALESANIESRPVWKPLHLQPVFSGVECVGGVVAEKLFADGLCLPSGSGMGDADRARVIATVRRAFGR